MDEEATAAAPTAQRVAQTAWAPTTRRHSGMVTDTQTYLLTQMHRHTYKHPLLTKFLLDTRGGTSFRGIPIQFIYLAPQSIPRLWFHYSQRRPCSADPADPGSPAHLRSCGRRGRTAAASPPCRRAGRPAASPPSPTSAARGSSAVGPAGGPGGSVCPPRAAALCGVARRRC